MKFRTEITFEKFNRIITPYTQIFLTGSCFAESISEKLRQLKFEAFGNPFGVLFNAASIKNQIAVIAGKEEISKSALVFDKDEWHSFYHNIEFSGTDKIAVLEKINDSQKKAEARLNSADVFIFTFGTSFVYEYKESGLIVSNCHKIHKNKFNRRMLSPEENFSFINETVLIVKELNPEAKIIVTVSPIRHLRDGLHSNQLSKASLLLAVERIVKEYDFVNYFASYEILLDDLRDYRFYAEDLTHPSKEAIEYIWERFTEVYFTSEAKDFARDIQKLNAAFGHRIINPASPAAVNFAGKQLDFISELKKKYEFLNLEEEEKHFKAMLNHISAVNSANRL